MLVTQEGCVLPAKADEASQRGPEEGCSLEPILGTLVGSSCCPLGRGQAAGRKFRARGGAATVLSSGHSCPLIVTVNFSLLEGKASRQTLAVLAYLPWADAQ